MTMVTFLDFVSFEVKKKSANYVKLFIIYRQTFGEDGKKGS